MDEQDKGTSMKYIRFYFMFILYLLLMGIYYIQSERALLHSTQDKIERTLLNHQALRKIIREHYIPEIQRLKDEGLLDKEYHNPLFTSGTFLTQKLHDFTIDIQLKDAKEATRFKYASLNPINPINRASEYEEQVLRNIQHNKLEHFSEVITEGKKEYLFYATHFRPMGQMCLRCHGDPQDAPKGQREKYGTQNGYYYKLNDFSSLITIRSPLDEETEKMHMDFFNTALLVFIFMSLIYGIVEWATRRIVNQKYKIAKSKETRDELLREMNLDPLTGLLNRRGFEEKMDAEANRARRDKKHMFFFFLDIDYFKQFNDNYGHQEGDKALQDVANILKNYFKRSHESVFRLGGEEFGVISSGNVRKEALAWAEDLLYAVKSKKIVHETSPHQYLTISIGIYILEPHDTEVNIKEIINGADEALYEAKAKGRNHFVVYK